MRKPNSPRVAADKKLCQSQRSSPYRDGALLRSVISSAPDILFFKDVDGRYLGCNQLFAEFVGRPREAIIGRTDFDLFAPEVAQAFRANDARVMAPLAPHHNEEPITYPDGRHAVVDTFKAPLLDADGRAIGLLGVSRDVTARKAVEEALRESEANFRTFFETLTDLVVVATVEGRMLFANTALKQKLGYDQAELDALHLLDLHPAGMRQEASEIFAAMLRGDRKSCPLPLMTKCGDLLPVDTRIWLGSWSGTSCIFGLCKDLSSEQEAHQRFERLFRGNPNPMALSDLPGRRFVDVNEAFLRTTGYTRDEVIGSTSAALRLFDAESDSLAVTEKIAADGCFSDLEIRFRAKGGRLIDGRFSGEVISSQGRSYLLTVMLDVSPYKRVAEALARERERLDGIIDATRAGTWEWHVQTGETEFNARWSELVGFTPDELGKSTVDVWRRLTHPDDLQRATGLLERHFRGETDFYECELRMRHKDGSWIWVLDRGRVCARDPDGKPLLMLGTHQDITERKRAESEAARLSAIQHELMLLATECINVAVERQNAAINQSLATIGNLIQADRAYLFSYDFDAGIMDNTHEWCAEGISAQIQELQHVPMDIFPDWVSAHQRGELVHIPCVDALGSEHPLWQILAPQGIQSLITLPLISPTGALGFVGFDAVTHERVWGREEVDLLRVLAEVFANFKMRRLAELETRRLQAHLERARDEAQAAAKAKSLFLAHMSHEIRTPLNAILGYAQIMSRSCGGCPTRRGVETILTSGEHLLDLLNNILFSAKRDSLSVVLEESPFDLRRLLQDVCDVLDNQLRGRPISLSFTCSPDVPSQLLADDGKIRQILLNLASNALKFTQSGAITLEASCADAAGARPGQLCIDVAVSDTGCGISESFMPQLFEPFAQAEQDADAAAGVGLGLPISRRLARALGGDLCATSVCGRGSTFHLSFLAQADDAARSDASTSFVAVAEDEPKRCVLIVDDDAANRNMLSELLRGAGLHAVPAGDGEEAIALLSGAQRYDVVLMDKRMPGMDGTEAIRRIRGARGLPQTPILLVTASIPSDGAESLADKAQADGCVYKPLRRSQLLHEIARVTGIRFTSEPSGRPREAAAPQVLPSLPPLLAERLRAAVDRGNMHQVRALVEDIRRASPQLAEKLHAAASVYNYQALRELAFIGATPCQPSP
jgi:PAS domain S-box-containing protein